MGGLGAHQRDHPVGAADHVDLGHHLVDDDLGDDPVEAVASADRQGAGALAIRVVGQRLRERGQIGTRDRRPALDLPGGDPAGVDPATDGVVADSEEFGGFRNPIAGHLVSVPHLRIDVRREVPQMRLRPTLVGSGRVLL